MSVGIVGDELTVPVGMVAYADALAHPHAWEMDFTGKPMRGLKFVLGATWSSPPVHPWGTRTGRPARAEVKGKCDLKV